MVDAAPLLTTIYTACGLSVSGITWELLPLATYWPLTVIRALGSAATGVNVGLLTQLATVSRYVV